MTDENDDSGQFSEEERITANLRLRSIPAANRTVIGLFVFIPPPWRGPVAIVVLILIGFLLFKVSIPGLIAWVKGSHE